MDKFSDLLEDITSSSKQGGRGPKWTESQKVALLEGVRLHGNKWEHIIETKELKERNCTVTQATSMFRKLRQEHAGKAPPKPYPRPPHSSPSPEQLLSREQGDIEDLQGSTLSSSNLSSEQQANLNQIIDDLPQCSQLEFCSECRKQVGTMECEQCDSSFCDTCFSIVHNRGVKRFHSAFTNTTVCGQCEKASATVFCQQCTELYCVSCVKSVHAPGKGRRSSHTKFMKATEASSVIEEAKKISLVERELDLVEEEASATRLSISDLTQKTPADLARMKKEQQKKIKEIKAERAKVKAENPQIYGRLKSRATGATSFESTMTNLLSGLMTQMQEDRRLRMAIMERTIPELFGEQEEVEEEEEEEQEEEEEEEEEEKEQEKKPKRKKRRKRSESK